MEAATSGEKRYTRDELTFHCQCLRWAQCVAAVHVAAVHVVAVVVHVAAVVAGMHDSKKLLMK